MCGAAWWAINDGSALGALRAFEEAGRVKDCAGCSQNGFAEARTELRKLGTRLLFSAAYYAELYGEGLMQLALDMLNHRHVPPAVFTRHGLLTAENVDHMYPNDSLLVVTT